MIPVIWLSLKSGTPGRGYWDQAMIEYILDRLSYVVDHRELSFIPEGLEGAVVVLPAAAHINAIEQVNAELSKLKWCLLILGEDESASFDWKRLSHPNIKIWVMNPRVEFHDGVDGVIGNGWPTGAREEMEKYEPIKDLDWFFCGQATHIRRNECLRQLKTRQSPRTALYVNKGFAGDAITRDVYYSNMVRSKVIPCPSGAVTPDSFRFFEALEAGAVPLADAISPNEFFKNGYWELLFPDGVPFPIVHHWPIFEDLLRHILSNYPHVNNRVSAWWQLEKRKIVGKFQSHVAELSGISPASLYENKDKITVLIPTSPIHSHPSTKIIDQTISSIRQQLPYVEIIIMIDGLRAEQKDYKDRYGEYVRKLLWMTNHVWANVTPLLFDEHTHQAMMTKKALDYVKTPQILFVEHDTPLTGQIPWESLSNTIEANLLDVIRLYHEASIPEEHGYLMCGTLRFNNENYQKTFQWSQRPHLTSKEYYQRILNEYFTDKSRTMIEDRMHGVAQSEPWNNHKIAIYTPSGSYQRSTNLDGRGDDPKYEMVF